MIYLCSPNNPTGAAATREQLEAWVIYALEHKSVILFDAAYEAYITEPGIPHSIYEIPGARGCTPQSCSFRDHFGELKRLGVAQLYGLSAQDTVYQKEAATRLHLPFAILSDEKLTLTKAREGDTISFQAPHGVEELEILEVSYPAPAAD